MANIVIVGGGAAGMIAAITARRKGAKVTILERNPRVGKKILATGNGRCNYTNVFLDVKNYHGENAKFVYSPLSQFSVENTIDFFERLGITHVVEDNGKVFPHSFQASSVLDVLRYELEEIGVEVKYNSFVKKIEKRKNKFTLITEDNGKIIGDKVIIATGGCAMPSSGSDGNGFDLALKLGHSIVHTFPGLVQLKLEGNFFKRIDGVKVVGRAALLDDETVLGEDYGDILFTNYGISGPPILQLSRKALHLINQGKSPVLKVSIIDDRNSEELREYLKVRFSYMPKKSIETGLIGLLNKRLIPVILNETGIDRMKSVAQMTNEEVYRLASILTDWRFHVIGSKSFDFAQVTAGGVDTREIDSSTMESKIIDGLYFAGEVVDIDGDCGGFNLQWAWSSGYVAGLNATL